MNDTFEKFKKIFHKPKNKLIVSWSILISIIIILFFCFIYSDILITTKHSINLLQTIYSGHPLGFYSSNYGLVVDKFLPIATMACYELPIFIIFAIWNIPLWIAQNFYHVQITESLICLIWLKSILLVFLVSCALVIKKICVEIQISKKYIPWVVFAFVSSPLLIMPIFIMNQYDIIELFFILLGLLVYIKGKFKWFVFWFAIAILIKLFALFIFIPLVLLMNKKSAKIIKYICIGLLPLLITKLISYQMPMYKESMASFSDEMLTKIFAQGINVNFGSASLFCIALVAVAIYCYKKNIRSKEELYKFSIYIPLLIFSCFFMFVDFHPYWIVLVTPFIAITLFQNIKNCKITILLDILSSTAIIIASVFTYYWCYGPLLIERMILPKLLGSSYDITHKYPYVSDLLESFGIQKYLPFLLAIYVTCIVAILIINFPRNMKDKDDSINSDKAMWGLLIFRMLIIIPIPILMVFCYFKLS